MEIRYNAELVDISGLSNLEMIGGSLNIYFNQKLRGRAGLELRWVRVWVGLWLLLIRKDALTKKSFFILLSSLQLRVSSGRQMLLLRDRFYLAESQLAAGLAMLSKHFFFRRGRRNQGPQISWDGPEILTILLNHTFLRILFYYCSCMLGLFENWLGREHQTHAIQDGFLKGQNGLPKRNAAEHLGPR